MASQMQLYKVAKLLIQCMHLVHSCHHNDHQSADRIMNTYLKDIAEVCGVDEEDSDEP